MGLTVRKHGIPCSEVMTRTAIFIQKTVAVMNVVMALLSTPLLLLSVGILIRHQLTGLQALAFGIEVIVNLTIIIFLVYLAIGLWQLDRRTLRLALYFFAVESIFLLAGFVALLIKTNDRGFWLAFGLGNIAFLPQLMTIYPISIWAGLFGTYIATQPTKAKKDGEHAVLFADPN